MEILHQIWTNILDVSLFIFQSFKQITWLSEPYATIVFRLICSYLIIFVLILPLQRLLKKKKIRLQKEVVAAVDEMIYLLARTQHLKQLNLKNLGGSPNIALMKSIFTKGNYNYIQSSSLILENMHKVESLLGERVISGEKEQNFTRLLKRIHFVSFFEGVFRGILTIATLGIFALIG